MANKKGLTIKVEADDVVYTSIQKSKDNYNSARMVVKVADKAYINISVEWESDVIPALAMEMMGMLTAGKIEPNMVVAGREADYAEYEEGVAKCSTSKPKKAPKKEKKMKKEDSDLEDE